MTAPPGSEIPGSATVNPSFEQFSFKMPILIKLVERSWRGSSDVKKKTTEKQDVQCLEY